ncbi:MAG: PIN domain-containing protein [Allomuricauda sp.]
MKDIFPGYNKKGENEIKKIWDSGIICFDANVLLNLYRYSDSTRKALIDLIKKFSSQIWLPHQAALEYNRNRYEVIADQEKAYKEFISKIGQIENDLQSTSKPPFLSDKLHGSLKTVFKEVNSEVENSIKKYCDFLQKDTIYEELSKIFKDKISSEYSEDKLAEITKIGSERYQKKIPPGYEDEKTKQDDRKYGDLVLWNQILDKAKNDKRPIILITDERKTDWWWKLKDGRNMGPRHELVQELKKEADVDFHMYSSERFLSYGLDHLKERINRKALEEIKEIKRAEIEELERVQKIKFKDIIKLKEERERRERERTNFLNHKIDLTRDQIERYKIRLRMLEERPYDKLNNEEELMHLSIDIKDLESRLEELIKMRDFNDINDQTVLRNFFREFNRSKGDKT